MWWPAKRTRCKTRMKSSSRNSNTSRSGGFAKRAVFRALAVAVIAAELFLPLAVADDRDGAISHYIRDRWGTDKGFPGGTVSAITQTTDGYLWIGTEKGLI